jgi:hypothetical protein
LRSGRSGGLWREGQGKDETTEACTWLGCYCVCLCAYVWIVEVCVCGPVSVLQITIWVGQPLLTGHIVWYQ